MTRFADLVRELEAAGAVALVPGELAGWCRHVEAVLEQIVAGWSAERRRLEGLLEQTARDDPAQGQRVENLRRRLDELAGTLAMLVGGLSSLGRGEPGSSREPRARGLSLRDELLGFAAAHRALDAEVSTWFAEAQYRDRGVVD